MATLSDSMVAFADALVTLLETNKVTLGLQEVYYGDQERLPVTPVACIEPDLTTRVLNGIPRKTAVTLNAFILLYHAGIRSPQSNRRDADLLAESVEALIHQNKDLDGLVIHCMVTQIESGYATKADSIIRASRLTVQATSQALLPTT